MLRKSIVILSCRHLKARLALGWRIRLTQHLLKNYLRNNAFYKVWLLALQFFSLPPLSCFLSAIFLEGSGFHFKSLTCTMGHVLAGVPHVKQEYWCWSKNDSWFGKINFWLVRTSYWIGKAICGYSLVSTLMICKLRKFRIWGA